MGYFFFGGGALHSVHPEKKLWSFQITSKQGFTTVLHFTQKTLLVAQSYLSREIDRVLLEKRMPDT